LCLRRCAADHRPIDISCGKQLIPFSGDVRSPREATCPRIASDHQGRNMSAYASISSGKLARLIGTANAPTLIDVRTYEDFSADARLIPGAVRRSHTDVQDWASQMTGKSVVVVCNKGEKLSEGTAAWLRCSNVAAEILEGGHIGWKKA